jgi:hypothetical protein
MVLNQPAAYLTEAEQAGDAAVNVIAGRGGILKNIGFDGRRDWSMQQVGFHYAT